MTIIKEYLNDELVFENIKSNSNKVSLRIDGEVIIIDFNEIINTQFSGGNINQEYQILKEQLNLGIYSKSPCGGFVNFFSVKGTNNKKYILYSGVNEISNSHYISLT